MYFLQKDDIMLHFTLTESSDITGCQYLLFVYLESVAGFKFGFKFGLRLNLNWKVSLKCFLKKVLSHNLL